MIKQASKQDLLKALPWEIYRFDVFDDLDFNLIYGFDNSLPGILYERRIFGDLELNKKEYTAECN